MPRLLNNPNPEMVQGAIGSFAYSGIRPERLSGASEYTLVNMYVDKSGSTSGFQNPTLECLKEAIKACQRSPRVANLLLRVVYFDHDIHEEHGFLPLKDIDIDAYKPHHPGGGTALYDAIYTGIKAGNEYAKEQLIKNGFSVNAVTFIITDGMDEPGSKMGRKDIRNELDRELTAEDLESHKVILIGINAAHCKSYLEQLVSDVGLDPFVDAGQVDAKSLAKLASFISRSISSTSASLGSGGPSQPLTI